MSEDQRFAKFGEAVWRHIANEWFEPDQYDIMEFAEAAGLCKRVIYDPDIHGYINEAEPGYEIWWWENDGKKDKSE